MISPEEQVAAEAKLAERLLAASQDERAGLYGEVYDRIYEMHFGRSPEALDFGASLRLVPFLLAHTRAGDRVLEFGCGTGLLSIALAKTERRVLGVDVSTVALARARERAQGTPGLTFAHLSGLYLNLPDNSVDFAFSVEVLEHLHEDDARVHLREIARVLKPGGRYWIETPHGDNAVSAGGRFEVEVDSAADVHLKEWTYGQLSHELHGAGFVRMRTPWWYWHKKIRMVPLLPISVTRMFEKLPRGLSESKRLRALLAVDSCSILAQK